MVANRATGETQIARVCYFSMCGVRTYLLLSTQLPGVLESPVPYLLGSLGIQEDPPTRVLLSLHPSLLRSKPPVPPQSCRRRASPHGFSFRLKAVPPRIEPPTRNTRGQKTSVRWIPAVLVGEKPGAKLVFPNLSLLYYSVPTKSYLDRVRVETVPRAVYLRTCVLR